MNKEELVIKLNVNKKNGSIRTESYFKNNLLDLYELIIEFNNSNFNENQFNWSQKLYNFLENITEIPKCKNENCNNLINYHLTTRKYPDYCCNKCAQSSSIIMNKKKKTSLLNNGVEFSMQSTTLRNKAKETCLKNYNVDNPSKSDAIQNKKIVTNLKKYNVDNYSKTKEFKSLMHDHHNDKTIKSFAEKLNISVDNIEIIDSNNIKIKNYCSKHNEFEISKDNIYNRINLKHENICTKCFPIKEFENEIFIKKLFN